MLKQNSELRAQAREALRGKWPMAAVAAELCNNAAIERSMAMMEGNKMKLFLLDLSFIGWAILCLFTFGIGFFVLQPYMQVSHAAFYEDLKAQQGGININVEVTVEN